MGEYFIKIEHSTQNIKVTTSVTGETSSTTGLEMTIQKHNSVPKIL